MGGDVFVLGTGGMLGHVVAAWLADCGWKVVRGTARFTGGPDDALVSEARASGCPWVINCVGRIKQKCADADELFRVNARLPAQLKTGLDTHQKVIHPSTDCVFSGRRGWYRVEERPDADDDYGFSKLLGEAPAEAGKFFVVRTSIVGPELGVGHGLMGWFFRQKGSVNGFTNHYWNGITTLEWAKLCHEIMSGKVIGSSMIGTSIMQAGVTERVSKFELLGLFGRFWKLDIPIVPLETPSIIDRTLKPEWVRPPLEVQLSELSSWYGQRTAGLNSSQG